MQWSFCLAFHHGQQQVLKSGDNDMASSCPDQYSSTSQGDREIKLLLGRFTCKFLQPQFGKTRENGHFPGLATPQTVLPCIQLHRIATPLLLPYAYYLGPCDWLMGATACDREAKVPWIRQCLPVQAFHHCVNHRFQGTGHRYAFFCVLIIQINAFKIKKCR